MITLAGKSEKYCYNQLGFLQNSYYATDKTVKFGVYVQSKVVENLNLSDELLTTDDVLMVLYSIFDRVEDGEWFENN